MAADYPTRAIKMVVPFAPGGGTDVLGRIIAQRLSEQWGQPVVVENQPGASGGIGTRAAAKADPDGYTLLMASTGALMAAAAALSPDAEFDVNKYFAPITVVAAPPYLVVINPNVQANSIADLIALAQGENRKRCRSDRRASAPPRISPARCSRRTPRSSCCTCPTRAPGRR